MREKIAMDSRISGRLVILVSIIVLLVSCNYPPLLVNNVETTNATETALFSNAEFPIAEVFLPFLTSLGEDQAILGKPVSTAYIDPASGNTIQYFQTVRLEAVKKRLSEDKVVVAPLGQWLLNQSVGNEIIIDLDCTRLEESDFHLCAAFRTFYENHQGAAILGKPISNVYQTGDRYYQYFDNACLVWNPYAPESRQVELVNLGQMVLLSDEPYRDSITQTAVIESMTHQTRPHNQLQVFVAFEDSFIAPNQIQQVHIQVLDEMGKPVSGATIGVLVHFPDDTHQQYRPACTDVNGMTTFPMMAFEERSLLVNDIITVEVTAVADQADGFSAGWFRIWE